MHCEIKEISSVAKELSFVVAPEQVDTYLNRASQSVNQKVRLKGYRPGKAPKAMLEQFYGAEIHQKAVEKIMSEVLFDALDQRDIKPVTKPRVSSEQVLKSGQEFAFTAHVEILPQVELKQWQDLEAKLPERLEVSDADVDAEIEQLRMRMASFKAVDERTVVEAGDFVDFSYVEACAHDGHDHHDHDHKPKHRFIELGKAQFYPEKPEVEQALVGAKIGVPVEVADMTITVEIIKECIKPVVDDEFAKDLSDKFSTMADLKADIRTNLEKARVEQMEDDKKQAVLDALVAANPMEVPESLVMEQAQQMAVNNLSRFPKEMAMNFWKAYGKSMMESTKPAAEKLLKAHLLLTAVAKEQNAEFDFEKMTTSVMERARLS
ncbi:MAG: trigger factor [Myxococcota bacterium]